MIPFRTSRGRLSNLAPVAWLAVALYVAFLLFPVGHALFLSLTDRRMLFNEYDFIGLDNYRALPGDSRLVASLQFSLTVVVSVTLASNVLGIAFAVLLNRPTPAFRLMRTLVFIPQVLSGVIVGFMWQTILAPNGILNVTLVDLGLVDQPVNWLGDSTLATIAICFVVSWTTIAFTTVIYSAGLQAIPTELYEAAKIDGANRIQAFTRITFPMLASALTISVTLSLIITLKLYDVIVVLTGGGPANSTRSTAFHLVWVAFEQGRAGQASAVAMLLLAITAVVAYLTTSLLRRREVRL